MASAHICFFFDANTLEILGHFVFQGTYVCDRYSEDGENILIKIEDYYPIPWGNITPIREDGVLKVRVSDISKGKRGVEPCIEFVDFHCGENPLKLMHDRIKEVVENAVREVQKELDDLQNLNAEQYEVENPDVEQHEVEIPNVAVPFFFVPNKYPS